MKTIAIVGSPNVGKSVIFNNLTGTYATVSNYPGTTVEVTRGKCVIHQKEYEVIDTPGMYSFLTVTDEEKVTRTILLNEHPTLVLHVIDAKNIERMLPLTLQLIEADVPLILVLNIMDEAERLGIKIDIKQLEYELGVPVVPTVSVAGKGMNFLREKIYNYVPVQNKKFTYTDKIEVDIETISSKMLKEQYSVSRRLLSTLILQEDVDTHNLIKEKDPAVYQSIQKLIKEIKKNYANPLSYVIAMQRQKIASDIVLKVKSSPVRFAKDFADKLSKITMNPWVGSLILFIVLYYGLYKLVGQFAAGTLVDFLENKIFGEYILPVTSKFIENILPWVILQDLFVHQYGIISLGVRYAVALILPIVGTFFLVFAIIEDTGYLPRLAMLIDRIFKKIGLSGRAVIPMVLGLGCDTMATMVTRTLSTKRERIIATILLTLAIPCSAQLGVILGLLGNNRNALFVWLGVLCFIFLLVGFLAAKLMPGEKPLFFMEIPPLRLPKISNVLVKTYTRMKWYFKEIFPLFILASVLIWFGQITGLFDLILNVLKYPVQFIGLPDKTAVAYLFGFFRRDYGAAGLYDMSKEGLLTTNQLVVAIVTMTLFLPCIAQFLINIKERGLKIGVSISAFVFFFAFFVGYILNLIFNVFNIKL